MGRNPLSRLNVREQGADFIEELLREECERLAQRVFEDDYSVLSAQQRYLLRLVAIERFELVDLWLENRANESSRTAGNLALA